MGLTPEELKKQIQSARDKDTQRSSAKGRSAVDGRSANMAFRATIELVSAIGVSGFIGYWIDQWLDSTPWAMIVMLFLGFIAGFLNIYRAAMGQDFKIGFKEEEKDQEVKNETDKA